MKAMLIGGDIVRVSEFEISNFFKSTYDLDISISGNSLTVSSKTRSSDEIRSLVMVGLNYLTEGSFTREASSEIGVTMEDDFDTNSITASNLFRY